MITWTCGALLTFILYKRGRWKNKGITHNKDKAAQES
jgi:hypothetical protein